MLQRLLGWSTLDDEVIFGLPLEPQRRHDGNGVDYQAIFDIYSVILRFPQLLHLPMVASQKDGELLEGLVAAVSHLLHLALGKDQVHIGVVEELLAHIF